MLRSTRFVQAGFIIAVSLVMAACHKSSGGGTAAATSYVRLVNATQTGSLGLALNQSVTTNNVVSNVTTNVVTGLAPSTISGYVGVAAGSYSSTVTDATPSGLSPSTVSVGLGGTYYTVLASERDGAVRQNVIVDNQVAPAAGYTSFAAPNFSLDAGSLDIYVVPAGTTNLTPANSPTFSQVGYGSLVYPQLLTAGNYTIIVTATGIQSDVRLSLGTLAAPVVFSGGEILTLALTGTSGGGLVNGVLVQQGGPVTVVPASTARVRVVTAFPPSTAVSTTTVAPTTLTTTLTNATSPSVGSYSLVPGGSTINAIAVTNGTSGGTLPTTPFVVGGDYTILVYGPTNAWLATVLTDFNLTKGSLSVVRLVNAVPNFTTVTLDVDAATVATASYGTSSPYAGVAPPSASSVQVNPGPIPCPICTFNLTSDSVYTYFVLNSTTPEVILSKDR